MPTSAVSSMSRSLARERESGDSESEDADARSSLMWCWRARAPHGFHMREESDDPESNGFAASDDGTSETSDERILDMEGKLSESQDARQEAEEHLKRIDDAYNKRRKELEESISELKEQLEEQHQELDRLEAEDGKMVNSFPGPRCLRWVEGDVFTVASTAVVLLNVIIIVREILDEPSTARWPWTNHHGTRPPSDKLDRFRRVCFVLDQAFLVFYLMEFTLRGLLMQHKLLCGELGEVIWNWLDLLIVVVGVIDQWILPEISDHTGGSNFGSAIRILRLLRLLRLMKVLKALLQSDLEWVEEDGFQGFVLFAILLNSILLGLQTDMPDFFLWNIFEGFLLLIFSFEIVVRIKHHGRDFFLDCQEVFWNMLDLLIVVSAVIDNWLFPIVDLIMVSLGSKHGLQADSAGMGIITLLRVVRLFRILRLARLIHSLPPLQDLVCGVVQAMHGMFWVLVLTCLMLFCSSILAMTLIEKEMLFADGEMPKNLKGLFPDVGQSMFVLFLVMNSDFEPVQDLLSQVPVSQLFIALFIVISNWAILAIFTAVVSENMITTVENRRMKLEKDESTYRTDRSLVKLKEFFEEIKPGEHELIYTHQFTTFLNDPDKEAELCDAAGISSQDLKDLLKLLSHKPVNNDRSYILEKDFLSGLKQQNDAANERSMMRLEKQIMALEDRLRHWMEEQDEIPKPPSAVSVSPIRLPRYAGPTARGRPRGNVDVPAVAPSASASP